MTILIIGDDEKKALREAMARARTKPIPLAEVMRFAAASDQSTDILTLAERQSAPPQREPEQVLLPFGYRVSISFEEQPDGMCLHLSMSTMRPHSLPRTEAVVMVFAALDIPQSTVARIWIEEFEIDGKPGGHAVNVVVLMQPAQAGTQ